MKSIEENVLKLFNEQLQNWELARQNYADLKEIKQRKITTDGCNIELQFNPARLKSSAAKTDKKSIAKRACFLCAANRPAAQKGVGATLASGKHYDILLNPYPIFAKHLTLVDANHVDQRIEGRMLDMLHLAQMLPHFTLFYNGANCGASAPDHFHFQACEKGSLPVEVDFLHQSDLFQLCFWQSQTKIYVSTEKYMRSVVVLESTHLADLLTQFNEIYRYLLTSASTEEPMLNILCCFDEQIQRVFIFPRAVQRPAAFYATGEQQIMVSPAAVEMGGKIILPREEDFHKLSLEQVKTIYREVSVSIDGYELRKALVQPPNF